MFDYDFTDRVRRMLTAASEEAMRLRHECIGTEHLLLGLVSEDQGIAAATLARLGVPPASAGGSSRDPELGLSSCPTRDPLYRPRD